MTKKKTLITISSMAVILLMVSLFLVFSGVLGPKPMFQGEYPYYPDVQSITQKSDVIVAGAVVTARQVQKLTVDKTPDKVEKEAIPYTISTIRVTEVIKGDVSPGDLITVKQLGDYVKKPEAALNEMDGYLKKDSSQLLFLCQYEDSPYSPVNPAQGIVEIEENGILYSASKYSLFGYHGGETQTRSADVQDTLESAIAEIRASMN